MNNASIWIVMAVGPRDFSIAYDTVFRLLNSPMAERLNFALVVDGNKLDLQNVGCKTLTDLSVKYDGRVSVMSAGSENGLLNLVKTLEVGYEWCSSRAKLSDFYVKLDPDCVIFSSTLIERAVGRFNGEKIGMVGCVEYRPNGERRSILKHKIKSIIDGWFPFGIRKTGKNTKGKWRYSFTFARPFYQDAIVRAKRNGWVLGESALGAFYMLSGEALSLIRKNPSYVKSLNGSFLGLNAEEDLFFSFFVYAVGYRIVELDNQATNGVKAWLDAFTMDGISIESIKNQLIDAAHPAKASPDACPVRGAMPIRDGAARE